MTLSHFLTWAPSVHGSWLEKNRFLRFIYWYFIAQISHMVKAKSMFEWIKEEKIGNEGHHCETFSQKAVSVFSHMWNPVRCHCFIRAEWTLTHLLLFSQSLGLVQFLICENIHFCFLKSQRLNCNVFISLIYLFCLGAIPSGVLCLLLACVLRNHSWIWGSG